MPVDAPATPETKDDDVDECADKAREEVDKDIADGGIAADDGELMHFVDGAVSDANDDWIHDKGEIWEFGGMEALDEARNRIAECAKENEVGKFACKSIGHPKSIRKVGGLIV